MVVRTMEDLNDYNLLHGHTSLGEFEFNDELTEVVKDLITIDVPFKNGTQFKYIHKVVMQSKAKGFLKHYYNLHNIGYLSNLKLFLLLNDRRIRSLNDIVDTYNNGAKIIDPFNLPVKYKLDNSNGGTLCTQVIVTEDKKYFKELLGRLNVYFTNIILSKAVTDITTSSYIHEITHSQLESNKGTIKEYYNAEVVPIFNELLYAYRTNYNLFLFLLMNRLNSVFMCFNSIYTFNTTNKRTDIIEGKEYSDFDYHSDIKYLTSTLKAFRILADYVDSDGLTRGYIIHEIDNAIQGYSTLEESLNNIDINMDTALDSDNVRKLLRQG